MDPLISVIVPVYKVEKYLDRCVNSILQQTYTNIEVWLVDDGSTDNCPAMCDDFAQSDYRIKVIHKTNGGLSDARNVAIEMATGDYLMFVDSDDYIAQDHIENLYKGLVHNGADVAVNTACFFQENQIPNPIHSEKIFLCSGIEAIETMFYQELFDTTAWGKIYKKSLFNSGVRYPKGLLFEDVPTTYRILLNAKKVFYEDRQTYYYLMRSDSIEGSAISDAKIISAKKIIDQLQNDKCLDPIRNAVNCRVFSFAFHVMLQMKESHPECNYFRHKVKELRMAVLLDGHARRKARVAAFVSLLGMTVVRFVFNRIKKR